MLPNVSRDLEQWLPKLAASPKFRLALGLLIGIGALQKINKLVSQATLNNFARDTYDWRKEVVVVTGGSGGLGDLLIRKLAKQNIKVISLDVVPSKSPLRQLTCQLTSVPSNDLIHFSYSFKCVLLPG